MSRNDLAEKLQAGIDSLIQRHADIFSAVAGIETEDGSVYWSGASGTVHAGKAEEMQQSTPFFLGSTTKMYTAAAVLLLEEQGLLSLEDSISRYLPGSVIEGLHVFRGQDYTDSLSIYHLLNHTSGLPDYFLRKRSDGSSLFGTISLGKDVQWNWSEAAGIARSELTPKFSPADFGQEKVHPKSHYSDTNYQLLGAVIESAASRPLAEVFAHYITEPLGLSSTYLHDGSPGKEEQGFPAHFYYRQRPLFLDRALASSWADGGMVSTVSDGLVFMRSLIQGTLFDTPSTAGRMQEWYRSFFPFSYGLGLMRFRLPGFLSVLTGTPELIGHSGFNGSFHFYSPEDRVYTAGTLNQISNQRRTYDFISKMMRIVRKNHRAQ